MLLRRFFWSKFKTLQQTLLTDTLQQFASQLLRYLRRAGLPSAFSGSWMSLQIFFLISTDFSRVLERLITFMCNFCCIIWRGKNREKLIIGCQMTLSLLLLEPIPGKVQGVHHASFYYVVCPYNLSFRMFRFYDSGLQKDDRTLFGVRFSVIVFSKNLL